MINQIARLFVREVNIAIVAVMATTLVASSAHYVSMIYETQRVREELCAARLELVTLRNPYLRSITDATDKCAALGALTDQPPSSRRASLR